MSRPQVRLDADVAELLQRVADRNDRSLSAEVNHQLRHLLAPAATVGQATASRVQAPSGIIGAGKGPGKDSTHRRARTR